MIQKQIPNGIEAGWQVSPDLYGDNNARLFTYWTFIFDNCNLVEIFLHRVMLIKPRAATTCYAQALFK
ncbi:hypothetical protein KY290_010948 [Solanum tuberosum]|uniref:Neprosin PEP catalytic domain-containing protein n=1 Tax=Solanum tuberosum TaxID=4113 RepID=A0ABQ7VZ98_SOLTU|nr:hypothetical protein KY290_010948 [Solanum tuberosum]